MTNPAVPSITTTGKRKYTKADRAQFKIDDVPFWLRRPKQAILAGAASVLANPSGNEGMRMAQMAGFTTELIRYVEEEPPDDKGNPRGRDLIEQRLANPEDDLDIQALVVLLSQLMELWFKRPTSPPRGSTPSRPRAASGGRASRARTR